MKWILERKGVEVKSLGGFPVIYADPPWSYNDTGCKGAAEKHYRTMSLSDIAQLPVGDLAAPNAALFMWGTYPLIHECLSVGEAWGFEYKSIAFQWIKRYEKSGKPFSGLGRMTRGNTEGCFLFTRGKPKRVSAAVSQLIDLDETTEPLILDAPIGRHSAKPTVVREKILQLMGDVPAIELFSRERVDKWECFGNQTQSTVVLKED